MKTVGTHPFRPDVRSVVLTDRERASLRAAARVLTGLRHEIADDDHPLDTDIALAAYLLGDLVEDGEVTVVTR